MYLSYHGYASFTASSWWLLVLASIFKMKNKENLKKEEKANQREEEVESASKKI